jgi:succinate dehydrogenase/fumarate reductase flavoprotein subunit
VPDCDLLVIGSGAAGLTSAITARLHGLDVVVIEKADCAGGTTAISGGWIWIPNNGVAAAAGAQDSREAARTYLHDQAGSHADPDRIDAYLDAGPKMVEFMHARTDVRFLPSVTFPDYHPGAPGAARGRSIVAEPFDARLLGADLPKLRRPPVQTTFLGLNIGSGVELTHFFNATRSPRSAAYVGWRMAAHVADLLRYGRGMRLSNGNALAARLLKSALGCGVQLRLGTEGVALEADDGAVRGATIRGNGSTETINARRGVVLATGGFSQSREMQARLFPHVRAGSAHLSPSAEGATGDGLRLGESAGGTIEELPNGAAWMPVSRAPVNGGETAVFPHVIDRAKPGMIAVTAPGRRFVNESNSYHDFVQAMLAASPGSKPCAWLVCDARAIARYGLGYAKPRPVPFRKLVSAGYLLTDPTLGGLAAKCGLDAATCERTVARFNADAARNEDSEFGKGGNAYNRFQGDQNQPDRPCLAPLDTPPFYAVRLLPGDIGTFSGLRTNRNGQVLNATGAVVPGLYAAGNDAASMMGGNYPGAGINIGPAMTFGYIIGLHAAGA